MAEHAARGPASGAAAIRTPAQRVLLPLALAQFICSFAGTNMNVAINTIAKDLGTSVHAVQVTITLFLLVMAALMIPGSKLTDKFGRKRCFIVGLCIYGLGGLISAVSPGVGVLLIGYSLFLGVGTALLIPPVYILATLAFTDTTSRARAFGRISGAGGIGAAAGPLIGGAIVAAVSWRVSFVLQAAVVGLIILLSRDIKDPLPADPSRPFDVVGAVLSAAGLVLVVGGILQLGSNNALAVALLVIGAVVLAGFFLWVRSREHRGKEALLSLKLFRSKVSNLGLVTQNVQWLMMMGISFTVSVYLQVVRGYSAFITGLIFTAATVGILASSLGAERFAERRQQRHLIQAGFAMTVVGVGMLLLMVPTGSNIWLFLPGELVIGLGIGIMLTPSVNIVQSAFPEAEQGEISGLSRSVSNLGSSLGTAIAGTILVLDLAHGSRSYGVAMAAIGIAGLVGLGAALFLPPNRVQREA